MSRIKRGTTASKRRKNVLKHTKGFRWGRKSKYKLAKQALQKAWTYAYRDRKVKKRIFRKNWQVQIGAACKAQGISYSKFIYGLKKQGIGLDRKVLAELANDQPEIFKKILETSQSKSQ